MKNDKINSHILFPAFVSMFINDANKVCIYYFRGLTENNEFIYQLFKEEDLPKHTKFINKDGSVIYEFENKITHIKCKLVSLIEYVPDKIIFI